MFLINDIVGYRQLKNYKSSSVLITDINSEYYKYLDTLVKYGVSDFVPGKYFKSIVPEDNDLINYNICSKKEIKDYLQTKKFMLSFENKLLD